MSDTKRTGTAPLPGNVEENPVLRPAAEDEQELIERVAARPSRIADGLIRGVAVLKAQSSNGRRYPAETLSRAVQFFEGARVFANHASGSRDVRDLVGMLRSPRLEDGAIRADLEVFEGLAPWLIEVAQRAPDALGLSINASGRVRREGDSDVVEEITRVRSVDVVAEPAAVSGLFESQQEQSDRIQRLEDEKRNLLDQVDRLRSENEELLREKRLREQRRRMEDLCLKAGLPEEALTESFMQSLVEADEARAVTLIGDRARFLRSITPGPLSGRRSILKDRAAPGDSDYLNAIHAD